MIQDIFLIITLLIFMIIKQEIKLLKRRISFKGPYILFFNIRKDGYNQILVKNMHILGSIYKYIHFLEIDFEKYKLLVKNVDDNIQNHVFMFHDGREIRCINYPNINEIAEFITEAVPLHNQKIEIKARNIGTMPTGKSKYSKLKNDHILKNKFLALRESKIRTKKKNILKQIITLPNIEDIIKFISPKDKLEIEILKQIEYIKNNQTKYKFNLFNIHYNNDSNSTKQPKHNDFKRYVFKNSLMKSNIVSNKNSNDISSLKKLKFVESKPSFIKKEDSDISKIENLSEVCKYHSENHNKQKNSTNIIQTHTCLDSTINQSRNISPIRWVVDGNQIFKEADYIFIKYQSNYQIKSNNNNIQMQINKNNIYGSKNISIKRDDKPLNLSIHNHK